jgi:hypothetical protein
MTLNTINSNFATIATTDANLNVTGISTGTLSLTGTSNLNAVSNVTITGGTNGQVLTTNGSGGLSWTSTGATPAGSNTQIQFNDEGAFGASANLYYNKTTGLLYSLTMAAPAFNTVNIYNSNPNGNIVLNANANVSVTANGVANALVVSNTTTFLGSNTRVNITGGSNGQVLTTNGSGALSWTTPGTSTPQQLTANLATGGVTTPAGTNTQVVWDNLVNGITGLTYNSAGVFTNSGPTRRFTFDYGSTFVSTSGNISEYDIWFQYNAPNTVSTTARIAQTAQLNNGIVSGVLQTSQSFVLNTNDTVTCWYWCAQPGNFGANAFGYNANCAFIRVTTD